MKKPMLCELLVPGRMQSVIDGQCYAFLRFNLATALSSISIGIHIHFTDCGKYSTPPPTSKYRHVVARESAPFKVTLES